MRIAWCNTDQTLARIANLHGYARLSVNVVTRTPSTDSSTRPSFMSAMTSLTKRRSFGLPTIKRCHRLAFATASLKPA